MKRLPPIKRDGEFAFWVLAASVYGVPNVLAFLSAIEAPVINVDLILVRSSLDEAALFSCIAVVLLTLLFVVYCGRIGRGFFPDERPKMPPKIVGVIVFSIQMCGLLAVLLLDFGRVGGSTTSSSPIAIFISYFSPDAIFLAYYGNCRDRKVPYLNLGLFVVSNVMRGWGGLWLLLFFLEFYYVAQRFSGRRLFTVLLLMATVTLVAFPSIMEMREKIRGSEVLEQPTFSESIDKLLNRLQQFTAVALIAQEAESLDYEIKQGRITPFYADNQIGEKFMPAERPVSIQHYLSTRYLIDYKDVPPGYYLEDVGWYVHTGIAGWLFVLDWYLIPFYLLFVGFLIIFPYWISARFIGPKSILPMLHSAALIYVFHGWFSVQISFFSGLIFYIVLLKLFRPAAKRTPTIAAPRRPMLPAAGSR